MARRTSVCKSSTERTAKLIATKHMAAGQTDPIKMIVEAIEDERNRCIDLFVAAMGQRVPVPVYMIDPDFDE